MATTGGVDSGKLNSVFVFPEKEFSLSVKWRQSKLFLTNSFPLFIHLPLQRVHWVSNTLHAGHHSAMVAVGGMPVWQAARGLSLPGNGHCYAYRGLSHLSLPLSFP